MGTPDRLGEVLEKCSRDELLLLAATVHKKPEPPAEWAGRSSDLLRRDIERELRYLGSSSLAFVWRKVLQGEDRAGVPYDEIVDDLIRTTHLNEGTVKRVGEKLSDHVYAKELLFMLLFSLSTDTPEASPGKRTPLVAILGAGLKAIKGTGVSPYSALAQTARAALYAAERGLPLARAASRILGPVATALTAVDVGRAVYALQAPDLGLCAITVALLGSLRLKYFPIPDEKLRGLEAFIASLDRECTECGKRIEKPEESCILCWVALHRDCGSEMKRIDTDEQGRVCTDCRRKDLEREGLLVPCGISPQALMAAFGYRVQVLNNRLDHSAKDIERALLGIVENIGTFRKETLGDLERMLRKAFGYIYVMFFTTVFLSLLGIAYFQSARVGPSPSFYPGLFFRFALLITLVLPLGIWFAGALRRAMLNKKREDFEKRPDGSRLSLRDYLFGFLYYHQPIENIWGPITLIGATVALLIGIFFSR